MQTKIIATLGPASMNYAVMKQMVEYGVRIFRLNFSHSDAALFVPVVKLIRQLQNEMGIPLTALGDLCGPKVRIGEVKNAPRAVAKGEYVLLGLEDEDKGDSDTPFIPLDMPELLDGLDAGMPVNLSDGQLQFKVSRTIKKDKLYELEAQNAGYLSSRKGIAFPGKRHPMPAMTPKDFKDLHEGLEIGIDAVALSFVQGPEDVQQLKDEIKKHGVWTPVVVKLERANALEKLDEILKLTDVLMVARGDLGLECPLWSLPVIQKRILRACRHAQVPAIVATQMLLSMVKNPIPTRAETTDVANAIMDGADCVMLSEETAVGDYPVEAVRYMSEISREAVAYYLERIQGPYFPKKEKNPVKFMAYSACIMADNLESKNIVCHSWTGATARLLSSRRPNQNIYALTPDARVLQGLNFAWGVKPRLIEATEKGHLERVEEYVQNTDDFEPGSCTILTSGQRTPGQEVPGTNVIKAYFK